VRACGNLIAAALRLFLAERMEQLLRVARAAATDGRTPYSYGSRGVLAACGRNHGSPERAEAEKERPRLENLTVRATIFHGRESLPKSVAIIPKPENRKARFRAVRPD
jgi:hypothetical protein